MPNNPASRRAGATQVVAGNKIVRGTQLESTVGASVTTLKDSAGTPAASSTPDTSGIPSGLIVMWSGTLATIPDGWYLCDGSNSTPDLRDRFIYGASAGVDPGGTGGSLQHLHPVGTLANDAVTAGTPAGTLDSVSAGTPAGTINDHTTTVALLAGTGTTLLTGPTTHTFTGSALAGHAHTFSGSALGAHNHTITGSTANNVSGDALPPYFKLAFIMKS